MEKAIHIANLRNLKFFKQNDYQRLYWGIEFCQNLIPTIGDTERILAFSQRKNLEFSFVTPFVTDWGLEKLKEIFQRLKKRKIFCEIIINDWGVLECLNNEFENNFTLSLGRLLARQQREPTIQKALERQLPFALKRKDGKIEIVVHKTPNRQYNKGIRASYINSPLVQNLFYKFGIRRVELNNVVQGLNLRQLKFKKSLYTPFINISTSRFCPMETKYQRIYRINVCGKECQKYYYRLRNKAIPQIIYKRGNTTFYKNPLDAEKAAKWGIDRLVFQPEIPF